MSWNWILPQKYRNFAELRSPELRESLGKFGGWVSIGVNLFLFVVKMALGIISSSVALIADAFHTLSDVATSIIVVVSFRISQKPGDREHPFGHGRADYIAAIIVATLLGVTGFEIGRAGLMRLISPKPLHPSVMIMVLVAATIVIKEGLSRFSIFLADELESSTMEADAWHHRSDAISSVMVLMAIALSFYGWSVFDGVTGMAIGIFIIYTAFRVVKKSVDALLGTVSAEEQIQKIEELALSVAGVMGVHDVILHSYGMVKVISFHIEVDEQISLLDAHQISVAVDHKIQKELGYYTTIHVDPVMKRTAEYRKIERRLREFCADNPEILSFHDFRILYERDQIRVFVDLVRRPDAAGVQMNGIEKSVEEIIRSKLGKPAMVEIKVEPRYALSRRSRHDRSR